MRHIRWLAVALVAFGAGGGLVRADDAPARPSGEGWLAQALGVLRVRMEARLDQARLLERQGRTSEALEVLRGMDTLFDEGLAQIRAMVRPGAADEALPEAQVPAVPPVTAPSPVPPKPAPVRLFGRQAAAAIDAALAWLAAHQSPDGRWEAEGFTQWCDGRSVPPTERPADAGAGRSPYDVGVTALATLAFLGAGRGLDAAGAHRDVVSRALAWFKSVQDPEGCFGPRRDQHYLYGHAYATLAVTEAYALTKSALWKESAQKGIDFLLISRNPYLGWRYGVRPGESDTSVTAVSAFAGALAWVEKVTDPDYGRVGYIQRGSGPARSAELMDKFPTDRSESMTAAGLVVRALAGEAVGRTDVTKKGLSLMRRLTPKWDESSGDIDMYYWYFGTLATTWAGGEDKRAWDSALVAAVVPNQRLDGEACGVKGSWDPVDPWGPEGGRVYSTALLTLALEVTTRSARSVGVR